MSTASRFFKGLLRLSLIVVVLATGVRSSPHVMASPLIKLQNLSAVTASLQATTTEDKKLTTNDGGEGDNFGLAVAAIQDMVIIGAPEHQTSGAAYLFQRDQGGTDNWGFVKRLTASDGGSNFIAFGYSVGIDNDQIVIGARNIYGIGAAYVFERNQGGPNNWGEVKKIFAGDGAFGNQFGRAVAIQNDAIVVGAMGDAFNKGAVYIFERNQGGPNNWGEVKKITAGDGVSNDLFGASVTIQNDTVVVGAPGLYFLTSIPGAAYVFERNLGGANNWGQLKKIVAAFGVADDEFGYAVDMHDELIVVGARGDDAFQGSAYIFERNQGGTNNWGQIKQLLPSDRDFGDSAGASVTIDGSTVVVGLPSDDEGSNIYQGSAYIFTRNSGGASNWGQISKLTASDGAADDRFGTAVTISDGIIFVGAYLDDVGANAAQGSTYLYHFVPLVARDDFALTEIDTPIAIFPLNNDGDPNGDPMMLDSVGTPPSGTVSIDGSTLIYTPTVGFLGMDTFTYTISTTTESATASVSVLVAPQVFRVQLPLVRR